MKYEPNLTAVIAEPSYIAVTGSLLLEISRRVTCLITRLVARENYASASTAAAAREVADPGAASRLRARRSRAGRAGRAVERASGGRSRGGQHCFDSVPAEDDEEEGDARDSEEEHAPAASCECNDKSNEQLDAVKSAAVNGSADARCWLS